MMPRPVLLILLLLMFDHSNAIGASLVTAPSSSTTKPVQCNDGNCSVEVSYGLSTGAYVAIALVTVIIFIITLSIVIACFRRSRRRRETLAAAGQADLQPQMTSYATFQPPLPIPLIPPMHQPPDYESSAAMPEIPAPPRYGPKLEEAPDTTDYPPPYPFGGEVNEGLPEETVGPPPAGTAISMPE